MTICNIDKGCYNTSRRRAGTQSWLNSPGREGGKEGEVGREGRREAHAIYESKQKYSITLERHRCMQNTNTHTYRWGHPRVRTHPPPPASSVYPWVWVSFVWPPSATFSLFFCHILFFSPPDAPLDAPACQTGQTDWLHVPMCVCVCVFVIIVYIICPAVAPDSLPVSPPLLSLPLSLALSLSMCLCHSSGGTLRARRSGWSTWWSCWLVVWRGLTWHGGFLGQRRSAGARSHHLPPPQHGGAQRCLSLCPIYMFNSTLFNPRSTPSVNWYKTPSTNVSF